MATEARAQGRPPRGDGEVGRTRLLDRTRSALKNKPKIDMQRREIAICAGVTPALVSYYYPDKWDLFAAAARPVIEKYIDDLQHLLRSPASSSEVLVLLVHLYVEFNYNEGYLLDFYLENSERMARKEDLRALNVVYGEMLAFFARLIDEGLVQGKSPAFMQSSLWGLCKYLAQQSHLVDPAASSNKDRMLKTMAENVCSLFLNGAAASQVMSDEPSPGRRTSSTVS